MVTSKIQWSRRSRKQSICFTFVENSIKPLDLPLILNYRYTCKNKFTEQLQNFICSPCILFPYDMLHLFKIIDQSMHFTNRQITTQGEKIQKPAAINQDLKDYPDSSNCLLASLQELANLLAHLFQLHISLVLQQLNAWNCQVQACFATRWKTACLLVLLTWH